MREPSYSSSRLPRLIYILGIILNFLISSFIYIMRYFGAAPAIELTFIQKVGELLTFFGPSFLLLVILFITWKWEYIGGIILIISGFGMFVAYFVLSYIAFIPGSFTAIITGILFIRNHTKF